MFKFLERAKNQCSKKHDHDDPTYVHLIRLRQLIGWLGIALPWIVVYCSKLGSQGSEWPLSISATWYTNACTPFMIILGSAALLLICYEGYELIDDITMTIAGLAGLGICLFPCEYEKYVGDLVGTLQLPVKVSDFAHMTCAIIFFVALTFASLCLFTRSAQSKTDEKKNRNKIYIACGLGMAVSLVALILCKLCDESVGSIYHWLFTDVFGGFSFLADAHVWFFEMLALTFFGVSFLTKAGTYPWLCCDKCKREYKFSRWVAKIKKEIRKSLR